MTTSLAYCVNTGISLLDHPVNEPTVAKVSSRHQLTYMLAHRIPAAAASQIPSCAAKASPPTEGKTLDSSIAMKDMP
jgi:hypothetical protein